MPELENYAAYDILWQALCEALGARLSNFQVSRAES